jgi:hypothetical protein
MEIDNDLDETLPRRGAEGASASFRQLESKVAELDERVRRVSNLCAALLALVREKSLASEEELAMLVAEAEQKRSETVLCKHCHKVLQRGLEHCIYCGVAHGHILGKLP